MTQVPAPTKTSLIIPSRLKPFKPEDVVWSIHEEKGLTCYTCGPIEVDPSAFQFKWMRGAEGIYVPCRLNAAIRPDRQAQFEEAIRLALYNATRVSPPVTRMHNQDSQWNTVTAGLKHKENTDDPANASLRHKARAKRTHQQKLLAFGSG